MIDPLLSISDDRPLVAKTNYPKRKLLSPSPDHPDDYILEVDNSSLEKFTICQRKSELYSVFSRELSRDESPQTFGKLFHSCEELRLRYGWNETVRQKQTEMVVDHFMRHPVSPNDHRTSDRMISVLKAYNERYALDGLPDKVFVAEDGEKVVERPFKVKLCSIAINSELPYDPTVLLPAGTKIPFHGPIKGTYVSSLHIYWTGRIDAVISDSGLLWVMDHKTTSTGGKSFEEAFRLASQTRGYTWAAQKLISRPVAGLIMNAVLIRAPLKTDRGTKPREEFNRIPYFYRPDSLEEWERDTIATVSDFVTSLLRGHFPMTGPKSFQSACTYCEYFEHCQLPPSQRSGDLASDLYRDVTWSPIND